MREKIRVQWSKWSQAGHDVPSTYSFSSRMGPRITKLHAECPVCGVGSVQYETVNSNGYFILGVSSSELSSASCGNAIGLPPLNKE